jgi:hypothetical protein
MRNGVRYDEDVALLTVFTRPLATRQTPHRAGHCTVSARQSAYREYSSRSVASRWPHTRCMNVNVNVYERRERPFAGGGGGGARLLL